MLMVMLTVVLGIAAACGNPVVESNAKSNNQPSNNSLAQNVADDATYKDLADKDENTTENSSDGADTDPQNNEDNQESSDGEFLKASDHNDESKASKKDEYLKKLNELEEADRNAEVKTTMVEMKEQEAERFHNWDELLNEIYGVLKEQLDPEQMAKLREEQRNWVEHRDEAAKEASLKYEGGSMEALEYVATQASLTKERCYELVANYMK